MEKGAPTLAAWLALQLDDGDGIRLGEKPYLWSRGSALPGTGDGNDLDCIDDAQRRCGADRFANVTGREMSVVLLDHASVGMTEITRHDHQRHAVHDHQRRIGVAQGVE